MRLLVIEDDPDIALGLRLDLVNEGYDVQLVQDGAVAAKRAVAEAWDLILLDVMLPSKDGFEVCRDIRARGVRTPILMLTALAGDAEKVLGLDTGADDYLTKPFSPRELRARIRALLRRVAPEAASIHTVGGAEVDLAKAEVRRGSERYDLTAIELKMLEHFIANPNRVISRPQIISAAWGPGVFVTDRVVDTHVVKLRRRIELDAVNPRHIVSVRGLGYRFEP